MSTSIINALPLKAVIVGTEIIEISENGTGSFKTPLSAIVANYQLLSEKGAISGYAGLDTSQNLLLTNFPTGIGLQVLRRNAANTALEFATISSGGITSINGETGAAQIIAGTANRITVVTSTDTQTLDVGTDVALKNIDNAFSADQTINGFVGLGGSPTTNFVMTVKSALDGSTDSRVLRMEPVITLENTNSTNGLDYIPTLTIETGSDHVSGFQYRPTVTPSGTATVDRLSAFTLATITIPANLTVNEVRGLSLNNCLVTGTVVNYDGIWSDGVNEASGRNNILYSEGGEVDLIAKDLGYSNNFRMEKYHNTSAGTGNNFLLRRARGDLTTPAALQSGDRISFIGGFGHDGTDFIVAAAIEFKVDGTPGTDDMPGAISFKTTADGASTFTDRWLLKNDGTVENFVFDANGPGNTISNIDIADLANGVDGELITWDAAGVPTTIAVGIAAQVLTSNGPGAAPTFQTNPAGFADPMTTRGDIIIRNASNVTDRLAIGANTFVLTSDGTDIAWAAVSGSGISDLNGLTVSTQTFAVAEADELGISSVTSTHTFSIGANIPKKDEINTFTNSQFINPGLLQIFTPSGSSAGLIVESINNAVSAAVIVVDGLRASTTLAAAAGFGTQTQYQYIDSGGTTNLGRIEFIKTTGIDKSQYEIILNETLDSVLLINGDTGAVDWGLSGNHTNIKIDANGTGNAITNLDVSTINAGSSLLEVGIPFVIDGGGSVIVGGVKGGITVPFDCTVTGWYITSKTSGSITVDVNKSTFTGYPTLASIAGTELPTLTAANKANDTTLTTWTTALVKGDQLEFEVDGTPTSVTRVTVTLLVDKT